MEPALRAGDWLLVDVDSARVRRRAVGDLVVVPDPRTGARLLVKRVASVDAEGRSHLLGDRPDASTDSRAFGPVDAHDILGRPWFRYWPARRAGRVR